MFVLGGRRAYIPPLPAQCYALDVANGSLGDAGCGSRFCSAAKPPDKSGPKPGPRRLRKSQRLICLRFFA